MVCIAVVNFISRQKTQTRQGLKALLNYCSKNAKTIYNDRRLVTGINCVAQSAYNEMMNTKLRYKKADGRMYYHLLQSFHPDEKLTPETAHKIALRFAEENFKGYEVLIATHVDRNHIHSHFVINSVNADDGYKYHPDNNEIQRLRDSSDKLCLEYGLSVIESAPSKVKGMSAREYRSADKGQSWKLDLAIAIDEAMSYAVSREHFIQLMELEGYKVNWSDTRKYITYTCPNGMKCRDNKLHEEKYLKGAMTDEFRIRQKITERIEGSGKNAAQTETYVSITEKNWRALIQSQQTQIDMLSTIMDTIETLATWSEINELLEQQIEKLNFHSEQTQEILTEFQDTLQKQAQQIQLQTSDSMKNFQSQAGNTSEEFSKKLYSAEEQTKNTLKKLTVISLIPTILLIIWELIRHIWLRT